MPFFAHFTGQNLSFIFINTPQNLKPRLAQVKGSSLDELYSQMLLNVLKHEVKHFRNQLKYLPNEKGKMSLGAFFCHGL